MNEYLQENKRAFILLTIVLFLLAIVLYFFLLRPQMTDLSKKQADIITMEEELRVLTQKIETFDEEAPEVDVEQLVLEKKIPSERKLDEFILSLQQLESVTNSKIEKIEFVYDSNFEIDEEDEAEPESEPEDVQLEEENVETIELEEEVNDEEEITIDPVILNEKPEALHVMTVKITAASPEFDDFLELIKTIEDEERISIVSKLNFLKPTEVDIVFLEDPLEMIPFEVELTTFYYAE